MFFPVQNLVCMEEQLVVIGMGVMLTGLSQLDLNQM